jgi:hypothetical protein
MAAYAIALLQLIGLIKFVSIVLEMLFLLMIVVAAYAIVQMRISFHRIAHALSAIAPTSRARTTIRAAANALVGMCGIVVVTNA